MHSLSLKYQANAPQFLIVFPWKGGDGMIQNIHLATVGSGCKPVSQPSILEPIYSAGCSALAKSNGVPALPWASPQDLVNTLQHTPVHSHDPSD